MLINLLTLTNKYFIAKPLFSLSLFNDSANWASFVKVLNPKSVSYDVFPVFPIGYFINQM